MRPLCIPSTVFPYVLDGDGLCRESAKAAENESQHCDNTLVLHCSELTTDVLVFKSPTNCAILSLVSKKPRA
jgi:hypothetical protein